MKNKFYRRILAAILFAASLCCSQQAASLTCTVTMTDIPFGTIDPFSSATALTGTLSYTCTATGSIYATLCFGITNGSAGAASSHDPRYMSDSGGHLLNYQIYLDSGYSTFWGSETYSSTTPLIINTPLIPAGGSISGTYTLYARLNSGQTTVPAGSYSSDFSGTETRLTVNGSATAPPGVCGTGSTRFPFLVSATVAANCLVNASTLDFGTVGLLTSPVTGTSTITVQCTNGSPYTISLDNGLNAAGSTRQMKSGSNYVSYLLYQDSARTTQWNASSTVSGVGSGSTQAYTVYGSVPAQSSPPPGNYTDTVTITVTY